MQFRLVTIVLFFVLGLFVFDDAEAQKRRRYKPGKSKYKSGGGRFSGGRRSTVFKPFKYVGFNVNALNYYGDLAPAANAASTDISFTRPGFGVLYGYRFHPNASIRFGLNWGMLRGDDFNAKIEGDGSGEARYQRNLSFRNNIYEFTMGMAFYILPEHSAIDYRLPFNAYIFLGGGVFYHDPQGKVPDADYQSNLDGSVPIDRAGEWVSLRPLKTEGQENPYKSFEFNIPVTAGAHLRIPGTMLDVHLELGTRILFTDYLDDVSSTYANLEVFGDNALARVMSDRSVEPVAAVSGLERSGYTATPLQFGDETYYVNTAIRSNGDGLSIRGGKSNDLYFMTQIRVTYILRKRTRTGTGKFR